MSDRSEPSGHRALPHPADLILQAWAPTRLGCLREAVLALVDSFADVPPRTGAAAGTGRPGARRVPFHVAAGDEAEQLLSVLGETLYAIDALGLVPVDVELRDSPDGGGGLDGVFSAVPADAVEVVGAVPKAVAYSELEFAWADGRWRCRFTVDV